MTIEDVRAFALRTGCSSGLSELDEVGMRELVLDAWAMAVPKRVAAAYADAR